MIGIIASAWQLRSAAYERLLIPEGRLSWYAAEIFLRVTQPNGSGSSAQLYKIVYIGKSFEQLTKALSADMSQELSFLPNKATRQSYLNLHRVRST